MDAGKGKTGRTAQGCVGYIRNRKPDFIMLECVKQLGATNHKGEKSDLDSITSLCNLEGYLLLPRVLDAASYGYPQSRGRYYLLGVRVEQAGTLDQLRENFVFPEWYNRANAYLNEMKVEPVPLDRFITGPANHYSRDQHLDSAPANDGKRGKKTKREPDL